MSTIPPYIFNRRDLIPFIRRIHPDLYQAEKPEVRDGNLRCIQDLYEIFDFLNAMQTSITGTTLTQSGAIPNRINPLPASYAFAFACHSGSSNEQAEGTDKENKTEGAEFNAAHVKSQSVQSAQTKTNPQQPTQQLQHIKLKITPPKVFSSLSAGAQLSSAQKQSAMHALQRELSGLFALVGLDVPWKDLPGGGTDADDTRGGLGKQNGKGLGTVEDLDDLWASLATYTPSNTTAGGSISTGKGGKAAYSAMDRAQAKRLGFDLTALDERAFDRHVQEMHRLRRAQALVRSGALQQSAASSSSITTSTSTSTSSSGNSNRRISRLSLVEAEVDYFFQSGRVLLRGVPLSDEMDAIRRLKAFLTENNGPLHFSCERWAGVTMILVHKPPPTSANGQAAKLAKNDPSQYTFRWASEYIAARAVASANVSDDDSAPASSVVPIGTDEDAASKRNDVVLEFPWDFRPGLLLDICSRLPAVSAMGFDGKVRL